MLLLLALDLLGVGRCRGLGGPPGGSEWRRRPGPGWRRALSGGAEHALRPYRRAKP